MKKFIAMILCVLVMVALCACGGTPEYVDTPDGETVPYVQDQKSFTYQSDEWVITKVDVVLPSGGSHANVDYIITMQTDEYAVGAKVDYKHYVLLNVGDVISATYSEKYEPSYNKTMGRISLDGTSFSAVCYPR